MRKYVLRILGLVAAVAIVDPGACLAANAGVTGGVPASNTSYSASAAR